MNFYDELDIAALQLRIQYDFMDDYLSVRKLAEKMHITLTPYSKLDGNVTDFVLSKEEKLKDGFFARRDGPNRIFPYIFYNDSVGGCRFRFTIAHELKHYIFNDENDEPSDETYANHFARMLLIPTCIVMRYVSKGYDYYDLASMFDVSLECATYAYRQAKRRLINGLPLSDYEECFLQLYDAKKGEKEDKH